MSASPHPEPSATPMSQILRRAQRSLGIGSRTTLAQIGGLGFGELLLIVLVLLFFFGAKRLPEIGGSIGKGIREFKRSLSDVDSQLPPNGQQNNSQLGQGSRQYEAPPSDPPAQTGIVMSGFRPAAGFCLSMIVCAERTSASRLPIASLMADPSETACIRRAVDRCVPSNMRTMLANVPFAIISAMVRPSSSVTPGSAVGG